MVYNFLNSINKKGISSLWEFEDEDVRSSNQEIGLKISNPNVLRIFNIRGNHKNSSLISLVHKHLNINVPSKIGLFTKNKGLILLNLGPDELLLLSKAETREFTEEFRNKLFKINSFLTDVSDHYQCLDLSGEKIRWILSKGIPMNLDENVFMPGFCAQTILGNCNIILFCTQKNAFTLIFTSSFSNYILSWLKESSVEHGYEYKS